MSAHRAHGNGVLPVMQRPGLLAKLRAAF